MKVILFNRSRRIPRGAVGAVSGNALLHPECPIEQTFRSADLNIQRLLVHHAWQRTAPPENALFAPDHDGLRVLGHSERALKRVATTLRARFGSRLTADGPMVRHAFGVSVLEPYMKVAVNCSRQHLKCVRDDLTRRRGRIARLSEQESFLIEAEAPLASLLGYEEWLERVLAEDWDESCPSLSLSRYLPIDGDGPRAA